MRVELTSTGGIGIAYIHIGSLEELFNLIEDNGSKVVIRRSWNADKLWCIEIYDTYRE